MTTQDSTRHAINRALDHYTRACPANIRFMAARHLGLPEDHPTVPSLADCESILQSAGWPRCGSIGRAPLYANPSRAA